MSNAVDRNNAARVSSLRPYWGAAVLVVAVVAAVFFTTNSKFFKWRGTVPFSYRAVEARPAQLHYLPVSGRRADGVAEDVMATLAALSKECQANRTAENLHRLGAAYLTAGKLNDAHRTLQEAIELDPENAAIASDLAAANIASARYADAAEGSAQLLRRDPTLQSAAFNWALALQRMAIRPAAMDAWERYLLLDPSSAWANEARAHLAELRPRLEWPKERARLDTTTDPMVIREVVRRCPQRVRSYVQNTLLPRWVELQRAEDLRRLETIAAARLPGDPFLRDVVAHASGRSAELREAAAEWKKAKALDDRKEKDHEAIAAAYSQAGRLFDRKGSPMALFGEILAASNEFYAGKGDEALARIDRVERRLATTPYEAAKAEAQWVRGLVLNRRGRWQDSLDAYRTALAAARRAGETENEVSLMSLAAGPYDRIADPAGAEKNRADTLRRLDEIGAPDHRMYTAYAEATWTALGAGRPHVALAYVESQRDIATRQGDPLLIAETFVKQALALRKIGETARASNAIATAQASAARVITPGMKDRVMADVHYVAATLAGDPHKAVAELSAALTIWDKYHWSTHTAGARLLRGEMYLHLGKRTAAEADFRAGLDEMERERTVLNEPPFRVAFFERADRLFERLIELLIDDGRTEEALTFAERKRARVLLDHVAGKSARIASPLDARAIAAAVPPDVVVLAYTMLERGAAIWIARQNDIAFAKSAAIREDIEESVRAFRAAIESNDLAGIQREGRRLFNELIAPAGRSLGGASAVVIIPDGVLQTVPFSALVVPDGRYLVERFRTGTAPSASVFLQKRRPRPATQSILSVAEAAPEGFLSLPYAVGEAQQIAALYPRGKLLVGTEASPAEFLRRARDATAVHFGGHATLDVERPERSALVFESTDGSPALLTNGDIAAGTLENQPVITLAACSTARGKIRRNEGVDGLTTGLLAAGARSVVATLWDVDDRSSMTLFRLLHRDLRDGVTVSAALRNAQLAMLRGKDARDRQPAAWASAAVFGEL